MQLLGNKIVGFQDLEVFRVKDWCFIQEIYLGERIRCQGLFFIFGIYQVDDGNGEQVVDGQYSQGQSQQGMRFYFFRDGSECFLGWVVFLWSYGVKLFSVSIQIRKESLFEVLFGGLRVKSLVDGRVFLGRVAGILCFVFSLEFSIYEVCRYKGYYYFQVLDSYGFLGVISRFGKVEFLGEGLERCSRRGRVWQYRYKGGFRGRGGVVSIIIVLY